MRTTRLTTKPLTPTFAFVASAQPPLPLRNQSNTSNGLRRGRCKGKSPGSSVIFLKRRDHIRPRAIIPLRLPRIPPISLVHAGMFTLTAHLYPRTLTKMVSHGQCTLGTRFAQAVRVIILLPLDTSPLTTCRIYYHYIHSKEFIRAISAVRIYSQVCMHYIVNSLV